jgi:alpha-N-acetylglucosamine transferase
MEENRVNVLCMKWGTKYPAKYVNVLYAMVKRNLARPFRFVCLTDDPNGLVSQINHYPLPELKTKLSGPERGWNKLGVFSKKLYDLKGQVLCLDLDLIITGPIDDFFDYFGDVVIIRDWLKHDGTGNSSVYRFEIGSHPDIVSEFEDKCERIKKTYRNEQEYLSAKLIGKNALSYWPDSWCRSFKRHCIKPFSLITSRETEVPHDARFIVFHGKPDPHNAALGKSGKWYRRFEPATWIKDYWF